MKKGGDGGSGGSGGILLIFDFNDLSKLIIFVDKIPTKIDDMTKIFKNPLERDQSGIFSFSRSKVPSKTSETLEKWETSIA